MPIARGRGVRRRLPARSGAVLLEVLVALLIVATAAAVSVTLAAETLRAWSVSATRERELRRASDFLEAVSLWTRDDLDRRLGNRQQGPWRLEIARPAATLYTVTLSDSLGTRDLLKTALFRLERPSRTARR